MILSRRFGAFQGSESLHRAGKVDLVTHSMGVSMSMAALDYYSDWGNVRRFVNIAGGLHGLDSCLSRNNSGTIIVNMLTTACGDTACAAGYSYSPVR